MVDMFFGEDTIDVGYRAGYNLGKAVQNFLKFRGLGDVRTELQKRGINIEDIEEVVDSYQDTSFKNIFDSSTIYSGVTWVVIDNEEIRAQVRAEHDVLTEQDTVRKELQEQGINIDDLVITSEVSLHNVFHSSATYQRIEREIFREQHYPDESLQLFTLYVEGMLNNSPFKAYIGHKDILFPFMHEPTKHSLAILERVEGYIFERQADQTEIK